MENPSVMNAMVLTGHGGPDQLVWHTNCPLPKVGTDECLIRVLACGLNNTDINTRVGWYSKSVITETKEYEAGDSLKEPSWGGSSIKFPRIQGADVCGEVTQSPDSNLIGKRVLIDPWLRDLKDPDNLYKTRYFGSEVDGGFAQYTAVDVSSVHEIDSALSDAELATFATSYITAENMLNRAKVDSNDTVLVTGASGGVGSALVQLGKRRGARMIALTTQDKQAALSDIGAHRCVARQANADLKATLTDESINVVADVVGGALFGDLIELLVRGGRYTCSGAIAGPIVNFDLRTFYLKDLTFTGATIVPLGTFADLVGYIANGEIRPLLAKTYPLSELNQAQAAFLSKKHVGNIVVIP